jgi:hypothetical protein
MLERVKHLYSVVALSCLYLAACFGNNFGKFQTFIFLKHDVNFMPLEATPPL